MKDIIVSFLTGLITGAIFALLKLPVPAPQTLAGVMGIMGLFLGYLIVSKFLK